MNGDMSHGDALLALRSTKSHKYVKMKSLGLLIDEEIKLILSKQFCKLFLLTLTLVSQFLGITFE